MRPYELAGLDTPAKAAIIMGSGTRISYAELEGLINQRAHALRTCGLAEGDKFAFQIENGPEFLATALAGLRCGMIAVPLSTLLTASEVGVIVADSESKLVIVSPHIGRSLEEIAKLEGLPRTFCLGRSTCGFRSWSELCQTQSGAPVDQETPGREMLYSSGTTGRPKGIVYHGVAEQTPGGVSEAVMAVADRFGLTDRTVYLCPAPLYHSAPYAWAIAVLRLGGTLVLMEKFDPQRALDLIQTHRVTAVQFVPTHFVRILKLPQELRDSCDISSLELVIHAAAPCPVEVKQAMIDWFGPIVVEYFGSSEQSVLTMIGSHDWLEHPGSVGRATSCVVHICDDAGREVPAGTVGTIYCEGGMDFSYHRDPERSKAARNAMGWTTVGDVGYLDEDGFLYLTDRGTFLIITGGVNVYPQEIENLLVTHPAVADAAVIGVPNEEMGEIVTAVVQLLKPERATPACAEELRAWMRTQLSGAKLPKRVLFADELPRLPTGKMKKHLLLDQIAEK